MKKVIALILLTTLLFGENSIKFASSYKKALDSARENGKSILFITTIKGCPVCDYIKDIVLKREKIVDYVNEHFVVVLKDAERDHYPKRFHTIDMPTFYFIDADSEEYLRKPKVGGATPKQFLSILKGVIEPDLNTTVEEKGEK